MTRSSLSDLALTELNGNFNTQHYVDGLIEFIRSSATPITIALQGEWGSGKTSLMNELKLQLCGEDCEFIGVELNTWEYSLLSTPELTIIRILQKLLSELTDHSSVVYALEQGKGVARGFLKTALGVISKDTTLADELLDAASHNSLADLRAMLEKNISEKIAGKKNGTRKSGVIVFIDDLDRLNPKLAVEILEILKNVFTLKNCIFILAIDYEVVVKGLKPKFGELTSKNEREFRSFFDKIIQVPFSLPVSEYEPMDFVLKSLVSVGFLTQKEISSQDESINKFLGPVVDLTVGHNPRSIKRLINTLSLIDKIRQAKQQSDQTKDENWNLYLKILLFAVVGIQICYPKIHRMILREPAFVDWRADTFELSASDQEETIEDWGDVLALACKEDVYLSSHQNGLNKLLNQIKTIAELIDDDYVNAINQVLKFSTVTEVEVKSRDSENPMKEILNYIYTNIESRLRNKRIKLDKKRRDYRGGEAKGRLSFTYKKRAYDIGIELRQEKNNALCVIEIPTYFARPESYGGKAFSTIVNSNENFSFAFKNLAARTGQVLRGWGAGKGCFIDNQKSFKSFKDWHDSWKETYEETEGALSGNAQLQFVLDDDNPQQEKLMELVAELIDISFEFTKALCSKSPQSSE